MPQVTVSVVSGASISGDVDLRKGRLQALFVPTIDSADLMLRGSFDTTSANFVRVMQTTLDGPVSGDLIFRTALGSRMILFPDNVPSPSYLRLELGAAQTVQRDFVIRFH